MKRVATAVVLVPLVLALVFDAPYWLMSLVLALVAFIATREYLAIVRAYGIQPFGRLTLAAVLITLLLPLTYLAWPNLRDSLTIGTDVVVLVIMLGPFIFLALGMRRQDLSGVLTSAATSYFGFTYVGLPLLSLWLLWRAPPFGSLYLFYTLVVVWTGDIFGLYGGRAFGRHKLAPRVSPNKTWEGSIASFVGSLAVGSPILCRVALLDQWLYSHQVVRHIGFVDPSVHASGFPIWFALLFTGTVNVAAQLGDLVESALKRGARLKDSGSILPGHGGMLDRIDALLFAAPVALILFYLALPVFPGIRFVE